jgi:hypothetical protein
VLADGAQMQARPSGIKISQKQWLALAVGQRRDICDASAETHQELRNFSELVARLTEQSSGQQPSTLAPEQQRAAFSLADLPAKLAENARMLGFELTPAEWARLGEDERYVLMKLGAGQDAKRNLRAALKEFLEGQSSLSRPPS